jgi:two-component system, chemotaxis family, protein-glutamate methylesterase/glutaminase
MERNGAAAEPTLQRDLVVIGGSAGSLDGLQQLVARLPPEFPAIVLIVLHVAATGTSMLPQILSRRGALSATFAEDRAPLARGQIYVAPPDHHLLVHHGYACLSQGPRENGHRPAVDPLFRSAARAAGPRVIGVVMSGLLDDGAAGLRFIKDNGGMAVVQDPDDAPFPSMPKAALAACNVDVVAPAAELADAICALVDDPRPAIELAHFPEVRPDRVEITDPAETARLLNGPPTTLTCPECGGTLWEIEKDGQWRYVCHVGHAFTLASFSEEQGRDLENTLWCAVRSLEERADVHRRIGRRFGGRRENVHEERAQEAEEHARTLRAILGSGGRLTTPATDEH